MNATDRSNGRDRAVSSVIAVILMLALTVMLASVVGAFALDGDLLPSEGERGGADLDVDADRDELTVTFVTTDRDGTVLDVTVIDRASGADVAASTLDAPGESVTFNSTDGLADGTRYDVTVTARTENGETVVLSETASL